MEALSYLVVFASIIVFFYFMIKDTSIKEN